MNIFTFVYRFVEGFFYKSDCCNSRTIAFDGHRWCAECRMPKFDGSVPACKWGESPYEV